uniref:Serine carboxypeptidase-like 45 n=1 Tax=Oryza barthii TaxID=65489 RepID=A0A0D3HMD6_9ORYZ
MQALVSSNRRPLAIVVAASVLQMLLIAALLHLGSCNGGDRIERLPGQPEVSFGQYAGYVGVDDKGQRALFYYFVEAELDPATKPLVLWLNGGPGCSSLGVGAFSENGPFRPSGQVLVKNEYSWNKEANVIYLETPAGVGYSYSADAAYYQGVDDKMTGHYIPQLADVMVEFNKKNKIFNLKGIALGNPVLEFTTDFNSRAEYFWSHGLISDSTYRIFTSVCNYSRYVTEYYGGSLTPLCARVMNQVTRETSRFVDKYDVTLDVCLSSVLSQSKILTPHQQVGQRIDVCVEDETVNYLNRKDVQEALHAKLIGVKNWAVCSSVLEYELLNLQIPTINIVGSLVKSGIRVLVYSGDQDSVIPLTGSRTLVQNLARDLGLKTSVPYRVWFEGQQVGGWTQVYGDMLSFATIRGASHEAPFSQPERSLVLFRAFLQGRPLPETFS